MGKGDGKKKRKKKSPNPPAATTTTSSPKPAPMRVSNNINIPVRHQIKMAQLNKQYARQQQTSFRQKRVERTSYRRKWDEDEIEQAAEQRRRKGQDPDWDVILSRHNKPPLVIVDGYNIIYKWARLKKHMNKGDPQRARQLLVDDLENLGSLKGWRIEVVFDGTRRSTTGPLGIGPGSNKPTGVDRAHKTDVTKHGVRTVFSGVGIEADTYIEKRCAEARNVTDGQMTGSFIVATDDNLIRLAGQSAGAHCMGADRFINELKAVKKGVEYRVEAAVAKVNGHAVRPKQLRTTYTPRFGRRSVLIEDKRNRTKTRKMKQDVDLDIEIEEVEGIPWWAQVPNQTKP